MITVCVKSGKTKVPRAGKKRASCPRGWKKVHWNRDGVPGAPGTRGAPGAPGARGSVGSAHPLRVFNGNGVPVGQFRGALPQLPYGYCPIQSVPLVDIKVHDVFARTNPPTTTPSVSAASATKVSELSSRAEYRELGGAPSYVDSSSKATANVVAMARN